MVRVQIGEKVAVSPLATDDIPVMYKYTPGIGTPGVKCMVCNNIIDISGKDRQYVVKCNKCNEATPLRSPPPDKKYVRCPCSCLLICKLDAQRVICKRTDCHRVIDIKSTHTAQDMPRVPGMVRVSCAFCENNFIFNTLENKLARCPHCGKKSAVGRDYPRRRGAIFFVVGLCLCVIAIITTIETINYAYHYEGLISLYVALFAGSLILMFAAIYFCTLRISPISCPF